MEPQHKMSPLYFFLSLGVVVTLITSVTAFINLTFEILNRRFPDILTSYYQYGFSMGDNEGLRTALALLIIIFPVFLIITRYWTKMSTAALSRFDMQLRKWVLYFILFLSAVTLVSVLVTLVRYFISGE